MQTIVPKYIIPEHLGVAYLVLSSSTPEAPTMNPHILLADAARARIVGPC